MTAGPDIASDNLDLRRRRARRTALLFGGIAVAVYLRCQKGMRLTFLKLDVDIVW